MAISKKLSQLPVGTSTTGKSLLMADTATGAAQLIDAQAFTPPLISPFCLNPSHVQTVDLTGQDAAKWYAVANEVRVSDDEPFRCQRVVVTSVQNTSKALADILSINSSTAVLSKYGALNGEIFPIAEVTATTDTVKFWLKGGRVYTIHATRPEHWTVTLTNTPNTSRNPKAATTPLPDGIIINSVS